MDTSNDIIIIDNLISKDYQKWIESIIIDALEIPWVYKKHSVSSNYKSDKRNVSANMHYLYENETKMSPLFDALYPMVLSISEKSPNVKWNTLDRMRINLVPKDGSFDYPIPWHLPHVDNLYKDGWNAIYYVNDMKRPDDGDTFIFEQSLEEFTQDEYSKIMEDNYFTIKQKITPKRGRLLLFKNKYFHAASFSKTVDRYVININLTTTEV